MPTVLYVTFPGLIAGVKHNKAGFWKCFEAMEICLVIAPTKAPSEETL
jgi:hypothetical protein